MPRQGTPLANRDTTLAPSAALSRQHHRPPDEALGIARTVNRVGAPAKCYEPIKEDSDVAREVTAARHWHIGAVVLDPGFCLTKKPATLSELGERCNKRMMKKSFT